MIRKLYGRIYVTYLFYPKEFNYWLKWSLVIMFALFVWTPFTIWMGWWQ